MTFNNNLYLLSQNRSLSGTDNVYRQISDLIFRSNRDHWDHSDIPQFKVGRIPGSVFTNHVIKIKIVIIR